MKATRMKRSPARKGRVRSRARTANPKDIVGSTKVLISTLPAAGIIHGAHAMMDGKRKYHQYNWRAKKVTASIYVDAIYRHIMDWFEGEECAEDSLVHHLGHVIGCAAILLDAQETGNLLDDRPIVGDGKLASRLLGRLRLLIKKVESRSAKRPATR